MSCFVCKKEESGPIIILNCDGDWVCSKECKDRHDKDMKQLMKACETEQGFLTWMGEDNG